MIIDVFIFSFDPRFQINFQYLLDLLLTIISSIHECRNTFRTNIFLLINLIIKNKNSRLCFVFHGSSVFIHPVPDGHVKSELIISKIHYFNEIPEFRNTGMKCFGCPDTSLF